MTNLLSAISGSFSKSLILGTLFPVVVFLALNLLFVRPILPDNQPLLGFLEPLETEWEEVAAMSLLAIVLSGVLYSFNIPIIRLYEGYPWKTSFLGKWRQRVYQAKFEAKMARWRGMRTLLRAGVRSHPGIMAEWRVIGLELGSQFPRRKSAVLPTRLGNVIRNFEDYANKQYGIDSVTMWPRMVSKIDPDYASLIDDAKTGFDFMIMSSFLFAVLALETIAAGLFYPTRLEATDLWSVSFPWVWVLQIVSFIGVAFYLYSCSIGRAEAWGSTVRGAFDLYRWDLLNQLGYEERAPKTHAKEKEIWNTITRRMLYGKSPTQPDLEYFPKTTPPIQVEGKPPDVELDITRGTLAPDANGISTVVLRVVNIDPDNRKVVEVTVTESIPEGQNYEWESAQARGRNVFVKGTNPYSFSIGELAAGEEAILSYRMIPRI